MEQQFILRLPDSLLNVDPKDCTLTKINSREVNFNVKNKSYPGIICRIPTVVESQKMVDNKFYKIADISTLIVIYENKDYNLEDEIFRLESSGLTPPMAYVKERKFEKNSVKTEEVEKIETKVNQLLAEDAKATRVEIVSNEKESNETDLDLLAAEIENEFKPSVSRVRLPSQAIPTEKMEAGKPSVTNPLQESKLPPLNENLEIKQRKETIEKVGSPDQLLTREIPPIQTKAESSHIPVKTEIGSHPKSEKSIETNETSAAVEATRAKSPVLIELEAKIKEKEEQYEKTANPIVKKRLEQAIKELKEEYQSKLEKQE